MNNDDILKNIEQNLNKICPNINDEQEIFIPIYTTSKKTSKKNILVLGFIQYCSI